MYLVVINVIKFINSLFYIANFISVKYTRNKLIKLINFHTNDVYLLICASAAHFFISRIVTRYAKVSSSERIVEFCFKVRSVSHRNRVLRTQST